MRSCAKLCEIRQRLIRGLCMQKKFFIRLFTGEAKLWQAWWLYGALIGILLRLFWETTASYHSTPLNANFFMSFICCIVLLLSFFHSASYSYVIWKCSDNSKKNKWKTSSAARILITLSPFIGGTRIIGESNYKGWGVLICFLCSLLIILVYLSGKLLKSPKILMFNHRYIAPFFLVVGNTFVFLASTFAI